MSVVYLSLGSNMGDKEDNIRNALKLIEDVDEIKKVSPLYQTEPIGFKDQSYFLNCVIEVQTNSTPEQMLLFLKSIEQKLGRTNTVKNGPRTIDIDILLYDDFCIKNDDMVIPHPRLHERLFVLIPLMDVNPDVIHPLLKKTVRELFDAIQHEEMVTLYKNTWFL
ncbi:MAG: 2-amino-4-hydroxy-6-hydroxymethyldihydropteridine diphosphokinase [Euryarchaeota archaeon]|nr:2-amino-4-hydroxy-6-hydroxymethyldihydropteridine diphosphokinase [Euryarchaeota archaeon]